MMSSTLELKEAREDGESLSSVLRSFLFLLLCRRAAETASVWTWETTRLKVRTPTRLPLFCLNLR